MFCIGSIISVAVECKTKGSTQVKIATNFLRSIDPKCNVLTSDAASYIVNGKKNPSIYVMDNIEELKNDYYSDIVTSFRNLIIPKIREIERNHIRDALILMIQEESNIGEETVVEVISGTKKTELAESDTDLATFLAGLFIFALKNTENHGGGAKKNAKKYLERVRQGEKPVRKNISKIEESSNHNQINQPEYHSRELELLEERIEQEAEAFCVKYEADKLFIPLCQIAKITNPTKKHQTEMYQKFCLCTASVRNKILEINGNDNLDFSGNNWWHGYFKRFEKDYEEYELGDISYINSFDQYFLRLLDYGNASVSKYLLRIFPPRIKDPKMKAFPNYKNDVIGFIDEYIYYRKYDDYKDLLAPPMDYMWKGLNLGGCDELTLSALLALFIIGTCHAVPLKEEQKVFAYSGPSYYDVKTAEDLFYLTLLTLYETYKET